MENGYLVLETGEVYPGRWLGGKSQGGEVVFNTSHSGYEEIATDPSYFSQIVIMTAPMQGNYGSSRECWESRKLWISGFVSLELQRSARDESWFKQLEDNGIPIVTGIDTRSAVLRLRDYGVVMGALVKAKTEQDAVAASRALIAQKKDLPPEETEVVVMKI